MKFLGRSEVDTEQLQRLTWKQFALQGKKIKSPSIKLFLLCWSLEKKNPLHRPGTPPPLNSILFIIVPHELFRAHLHLKTKQTLIHSD